MTKLDELVQLPAYGSDSDGKVIDIVMKAGYLRVKTSKFIEDGIDLELKRRRHPAGLALTSRNTSTQHADEAV